MPAPASAHRAGEHRSEYVAPRRGVSFKDYEDWQQRARSFTGLAAFGTTVMNVSDAGRPPERYSGPYIAATAFHLIGQRPLLGRDVTAAEWIGPAPRR